MLGAWLGAWSDFPFLSLADHMPANVPLKMDLIHPQLPILTMQSWNGPKKEWTCNNVPEIIICSVHFISFFFKKNQENDKHTESSQNI